MTDEERTELRTRILAQAENLEGDIRSLQEASRPVAPDNAIGRLTRMEAMNARSISEAALDSARRRLTRLRSALERMDSESFGTCAMCEEPIPIKRLMLMPEATRCVRCMED